MTSKPHATTVEAQGLALRVWDHGAPSPSARRVLFVHGYLDTGRSFDTVCAHVRDADIHALALDLRGHGQSDRVGAGGSYHLLDHVKDLAIVLRALAVDTLVGHSMGGNIALLTIGARPSLVKRVVFVDAIGAPPEDAADQADRVGELIDSVLEPKRPFSSVASVPEAAAKIQAQNAGLSNEAALRMVRDVMVPASGASAEGALAFPFDPRLRGPSPVRWAEPMWLALCARIAAANVAATLVRASDGYVVEGETTDARVAAMKATTHVLAGPHHLHVEKPLELARIIADA
jgi:pimeloyl-ACP methyl ester carboxylesterase